MAARDRSRRVCRGRFGAGEPVGDGGDQRAGDGGVVGEARPEHDRHSMTSGVAPLATRSRSGRSAGRACATVGGGGVWGGKSGCHSAGPRTRLWRSHRVGYAPSEYRKKPWPKRPDRRWFPLSAREHTCFDLVEDANESRSRSERPSSAWASGSDAHCGRVADRKRQGSPCLPAERGQARRACQPNRTSPAARASCERTPPLKRAVGDRERSVLTLRSIKVSASGLRDAGRRPPGVRWGRTTLAPERAHHVPREAARRCRTHPRDWTPRRLCPAWRPRALRRTSRGALPTGLRSLAYLVEASPPRGARSRRSRVPLAERPTRRSTRGRSGASPRARRGRGARRRERSWPCATPGSRSARLPRILDRPRRARRRGEGVARPALPAVAPGAPLALRPPRTRRARPRGGDPPRGGPTETRCRRSSRRSPTLLKTLRAPRRPARAKRRSSDPPLRPPALLIDLCESRRVPGSRSGGEDPRGARGRRRDVTPR
jgi:hypothetical protein